MVLVYSQPQFITLYWALIWAKTAHFMTIFESSFWFLNWRLHKNFSIHGSSLLDHLELSSGPGLSGSFALSLPSMTMTRSFASFLGAISCPKEPWKLHTPVDYIQVRPWGYSHWWIGNHPLLEYWNSSLSFKNFP